jgi:chromate transporter
MIENPAQRPTSSKCSLIDLSLIFLRLGATAFGGPAAHVAMMRTEFVDRRELISEGVFLDFVGTSNLLPGPSSTEVGIFIGYHLAGWPGLILSGACFILPAMLIVMTLAWGYVEFGQLPEFGDILYGMKAVVMAIVVHAIWGLGKSAIKSLETGIVAAGLLTLAVLHISPLCLIFLSGSLLVLIQWFKERQVRFDVGESSAITTICLIYLIPFIVSLPKHFESHRLTPSTLFLVFAKIGMSVFGSGYVLLAYLKVDLVSHLHWLTNGQLLDAVSVGQFTPGPVFTAATFIGYLLDGTLGAIIATFAIFLPAFAFVAGAYRAVWRIRSSKLTSSFLNGVNIAAVALMTIAGFQLAANALVDWFTIAIGLSSTVVLFRFRINSAWVILAGAVAGLLYRH